MSALLDWIELERTVFSITRCDYSRSGKPCVEKLMVHLMFNWIWLNKKQNKQNSDAVTTQQETGPAASETFSQQFVCWHHERVRQPVQTDWDPVQMAQPLDSALFKTTATVNYFYYPTINQESGLLKSRKVVKHFHQKFTDFIFCWKNKLKFKELQF